MSELNDVERALLRRVLLYTLGVAALGPLWKVTNGWALLLSVLLAVAALRCALGLRRLRQNRGGS